MKQTAIEWLIKELKEKEYLGTFCTADAWEREEQQMRLIIQQAKAMQKQQIIKFAEAFATSDAIYCSGEFALEKDAEHYYTETYGGKDEL
jgi:hypothetical protein